jgi:hypothetical protein
MEPEEQEPVRISRALRNVLTFFGVLLLVPSLCVVGWAMLVRPDLLRWPVTLLPGTFLLGLILIVFAIRAGRR